MGRENMVVSLDIGSSKVTAIAGDVGEDGKLQIVGFGSVESSGIRKGNVIDIENTVRAIEVAIGKAEQMSGREIDGGYVGITGLTVSSLNNRGVVAVSSSDQEIMQEDVDRVLQAAKVIAIPHDRRIIHVIPRQYVVDGNENILDPVGMIGSRLEVETHIVTIVNAAQRTTKSINKLIKKSISTYTAVLPGMTIHPKKIIINRYFVSSHIYA